MANLLYYQEKLRRQNSMIALRFEISAKYFANRCFEMIKKIVQSN